MFNIRKTKKIDASIIAVLKLSNQFYYIKIKKQFSISKLYYDDKCMHFC